MWSWLLSNIWWIGPVTFLLGLLALALTLSLCRVSAQADRDAERLLAGPLARVKRQPTRTYDRAVCEFCHRSVAIRRDGEPHARRHKCHASEPKEAA